MTKKAFKRIQSLRGTVNHLGQTYKVADSIYGIYRGEFAPIIKPECNVPVWVPLKELE